MSLLQKLKTIQEAQGVSDREFAARLGISAALWNQTKNENSPIRFEVLAGTAREFAGLKDDIFEYLRKAANKAAG